MSQKQTMTAMTRVLTTLGHQEPDRVPFFLFLTMHGAKELGLTIREYFSKAEYVVEGQLRLREKYRHDCYYPFFYAPLEVEAFGGEVLYVEDGPPNSGAPVIRRAEAIKGLAPPEIPRCPCLEKVLTAIRALKEKVGAEAPIIGVAISPFSLPVMQMGFAPYLDLIHEQPELFAQLMRVNEEFCVAWANAQLQAGATAICYFDPLSSPTIIPRPLYLETGFKIAQRTLARIQGPTATHFASGRGLGYAELLAATGTAALGVSAEEDLRTLKAEYRGKLTLIGNLNGLAMRRWSREETSGIVRQALRAGGPGGGFILADNHGEIPWQTPEEVLLTISETVHAHGVYPLAEEARE